MACSFNQLIFLTLTQDSMPHLMHNRSFKKQVIPTALVLPRLWRKNKGMTESIMVSGPVNCSTTRISMLINRWWPCWKNWRTAAETASGVRLVGTRSVVGRTMSQVLTPRRCRQLWGRCRWVVAKCRRADTAAAWYRALPANVAASRAAAGTPCATEQVTKTGAERLRSGLACSAREITI